MHVTMIRLNFHRGAIAFGYLWQKYGLKAGDKKEIFVWGEAPSRKSPLKSRLSGTAGIAMKQVARMQ